MFDVLIRGGRVVDGTGTPWFRADVGIEGDRIAAVRADLSSADAGWVVDATGLVVAPGFVDMHCHSEYTILRQPKNEFKVRQGVTTECVSQVLSPGPLRRTAVDEARAELARLGL